MPMQYGGDNVRFPDNSIQNTAPSGFGFKNRIINGDMRIDQRNAGASVTPTNGQYLVDRFAAGVSQASKLTAQQSTTAPAGFTNSLVVTSSSAYSITSTDQFFLYQPIEGLNCADLAWGTASAATVTLSFWVRSSLTGTFGGAVSNNANDRSYPFSYTINAANTWEQKSVTISGDTTGTWLTNTSAGLKVFWSLGIGSTNSGTAGAWAGANYKSATGATSVVGTNGATFYITGVQLEKGSTATSFDYRPYGAELALCQRYYQQLMYEDSNSANYFFRTYSNAAQNQTNSLVSFPVQMRATPTGTVKGTFVVTNCAQPTFDTINSKTFTLNTASSGAGLITVYNGNAGSGITLSAEL